MKLPLLVTLFAAVGYSAAPKNMMASIPLHFEPNVGQTDSRVSFTARGGGMSIFLTPEETVLARRGAVPVRMKLRGSKRAKFDAVDKLPGVSNYYRGNDPKKWREGVPHYARVRAKSVYEGIDIVYYGNGRRLEYDFVVAPGADPSKIELAYEGADSRSIDKGGDLVLMTKAGELRQRKPVVYQEAVGRQGQSGPVLTGITPGIFVDTTLSVTAPTLHQAIVRACPTANASQCSPDSDAGWGPWSQSVTGTTSFTITP